MQYGKKLRILRTVANYTQTDMGEKFYITRAAYGKLEREETALTAHRAQQAGKIFNCSAHWLMKEEKFSMLIQSDENGNLCMKILNDETELNAATQQHNLSTAHALAQDQKIITAQLMSALEMAVQINNNHAAKNQRSVRKRKPLKPRVAVRRAKPKQRSSYPK